MIGSRHCLYSGGRGGYWHWGEFSIIASNTTSRITFENVHRNLEMDAFSVSISAPPVIVTQPASISSVEGGSAALIVGVRRFGTALFSEYHNGAPLAAENSRILALKGVTPAHAGTYHVTVTNEFGSDISTLATLSVDAPTNATILLQPYGDTLPVGSYFNLSVVAAGTPRLS
jgi:hypothetical protein